MTIIRRKLKNIIFNYIINLEKNTNISLIPTKLSSWIKSKTNENIYKFLMNDCKNFGENFLQRLYNIRYSINEYPKCKVCGKNVSKFISYSKGYKDTCSIKCTNILKFGCEHPMKSKNVKEKLKQSLLAKYGVDNAFKSDIIKEKIKQTNLEKYNVENPQQNEVIKEKKSLTNLLRYNSVSPLGNKEVREKIKQTNLERYNSISPLGNKEVREKIKQTNLKKYGVETPMENDICKNNFKISIFEKYGVDNLLKVPEILEKIKRTNNEKYGTDFPLQSKLIQEKIKQTNLERYENELYSKSRTFLNISYFKFKELVKDYVIPLFTETEYEGFQGNKIYKWKCTKCGDVFEQRFYTSSPYELISISEYMPRCLKCFPKLSGTSYMEQSLLKFVKSIYNGETIENDRTLIKPLELDIVIPEKKIAIEFNGNFYHQYQSIYGVSKGYHLNKVIKCNQQGYRLIHIWEDEWVSNKDIIKGKLIDIFECKEDIDYSQKLDRSWFNNLSGNFEELPPEIVIRNGFEVENCGYLIKKN